MKEYFASQVRVAPRIYHIAFAVLVMLLSACATTDHQVHAWKEPGADFSGYQTYFLEPATNHPNNPRIQKMLREAMHHVLEDKGFRPGSENESDLIVRYLTVVEGHQDLRQEHIPTPKGIYTRYQMVAVSEGELLVNVIERKTGEVVWKGSTIRDLSNFKPEKLKPETVHSGVHELFVTLPAR